MEIIYIDQKSIGPSTDPWGIPQLTDTELLFCPVVLSCCSAYQNAWPEIPDMETSRLRANLHISFKYGCHSKQWILYIVPRFKSNIFITLLTMCSCLLSFFQVVYFHISKWLTIYAYLTIWQFCKPNTHKWLCCTIVDFPGSSWIYVYFLALNEYESKQLGIQCSYVCDNGKL